MPGPGKILRPLFLLFLTGVAACDKKAGYIPIQQHPSFFDVILVIGQSNTHQGFGFDADVDGPVAGIWQLGRFGGDDHRIIPAVEPLQHLTPVPGCIGFALPFAKTYKQLLLRPGHGVLILPCGMNSTGFGSHQWRPGDTLYDDALERTRFVLDRYPSKLVAILWHQGESDVGNPVYQQELDTMIVTMRRSLPGKNDPIPFILGGMVPYWVRQDTARILLNGIIRNTVRRIPQTGFADPQQPPVIEKPDNDSVAVHFDAAGQREMGQRYFLEYVKLAGSR